MADTRDPEAARPAREVEQRGVVQFGRPQPPQRGAREREDAAAALVDDEVIALDVEGHLAPDRGEREDDCQANHAGDVEDRREDPGDHRQQKRPDRLAHHEHRHEAEHPQEAHRLVAQPRHRARREAPLHRLHTTLWRMTATISSG